MYKLPWYFLTSLESTGPSVKKYFKINIQDGRPSWISDWKDFNYFLSTSSPDSFYQVLSLSVQEKHNIDFQDGRLGNYFGFLNRIILAIFDLQVAPTLPSKFQVNSPFGSREAVQNRFFRW